MRKLDLSAGEKDSNYCEIHFQYTIFIDTARLNFTVNDIN
jgi:hypothetical protein